MVKAVILIGGPEKGTRFRPLSLDIPKPLFPVGGLPLIQHHIEACANVKPLKEVLIIGSYPLSQLQSFVENMQRKYHINVRYLQEFVALGTAGGLYHFRDQIRMGQPEAFFLMNGDVCADFPLNELYQFHKQKTDSMVTIMSTEATKQQSLNFGCLVLDKINCAVKHYVEKPNSYVSTSINCGVYICSLDVFQIMADSFINKQNEYYRQNYCNGKDPGYMQFEQEVLSPLAGTGKMYAFQVTNWWSQLKTAGSAIYANRHYLKLYRNNGKIHRLVNSDLKENGDSHIKCEIIPDVFIHPSATVHYSAVIGPNVSIGEGVVIGAGVRIRESIILDHAIVEDHSLVLYSIIGRNTTIGQWSRVEGTPSDPDPNKPFAKMDNPALFNSSGRLNPSITILGCKVKVPSETILLNTIILPNKEIHRSFKNEIIL